MDTAPSTTPSAPLTPTSGRLTFLNAYRREHATTLKVLRAFPAEQSEFQPHERSSSARKLAWTFVVEETLMQRALAHQPILSGGAGFPAPPDSWDAVVEAFAACEAEVVRLLETADDDVMGGTAQFYVAPKQVGDYSTSDFLWFLLHDQIHHRGQLSVYVRMAGGKVPSIYGPSADEPWN